MPWNWRQRCVAGFNIPDRPSKIQRLAFGHGILKTDLEPPDQSSLSVQGDLLPIAFQTLARLPERAAREGGRGLVFPCHFLHAGVAEAFRQKLQRSTQTGRGNREPAQAHRDINRRLVPQFKLHPQHIGRLEKHHAPSLHWRKRAMLRPGVVEKLLDVRTVVVHRGVGLQSPRRPRILDLQPKQLLKERPRILLEMRKGLIGTRQRAVVFQKRKPAVLRAKTKISGERLVQLILRQVAAEANHVAAFLGEGISLRLLFGLVIGHFSTAEFGMNKRRRRLFYPAPP